MLSAKQRSRLSALAQHLACYASVGRAGVTEEFVSRLSVLLDQHELVKIRLAGDEAETRRSQAEELASRTRSELVRIIGKIALLYRANPDREARKVDPGE